MTSGLPRRKQYGIEHSPVFICDHDVRLGIMKRTRPTLGREVGFSPNNGHYWAGSICPFRANNGLMRRSNSFTRSPRRR
jgi:hypothetical protein